MLEVLVITIIFLFQIKSQVIWDLVYHSECIPFLHLPTWGREGTVINDQRCSLVRHETTSVRFTLRRECYSSSSWFKAQSEISDVPAIHTIEMIPKSKILVNSAVICSYIKYWITDNHGHFKHNHLHLKSKVSKNNSF